jgi:hypothetical protein
MRRETMRLEPLYMIRFFYPDGWQVNLTGKKALRKTTSTSLKEIAMAASQEDFEDRITLTGALTRHLL